MCVFVPSQVRTVCCCCQEWHCQKPPHTFSRDKSCLEAPQRLSTQSDINTAASGSRKVVASCFVLTARPDASLITDFNFILERRTCSDRQIHCDYGCHSAEATQLSPPINQRLHLEISSSGTPNYNKCSRAMNQLFPAVWGAVDVYLIFAFQLLYNSTSHHQGTIKNCSNFKNSTIWPFFHRLLRYFSIIFVFLVVAPRWPRGLFNKERDLLVL